MRPTPPIAPATPTPKVAILWKESESSVIEIGFDLAVLISTSVEEIGHGFVDRCIEQFKRGVFGVRVYLGIGKSFFDFFGQIFSSIGRGDFDTSRVNCCLDTGVNAAEPRVIRTLQNDRAVSQRLFGLGSNSGRL